MRQICFLLGLGLVFFTGCGSALGSAGSAAANVSNGLGPRPPANPALGLDGGSTLHNDGSASGTTDFYGPGAAAIQSEFLLLFGNCAISLIHTQGNPVVMCIDLLTLSPVVRVLDKDDNSELARLDLPISSFLASTYAYLNNLDQLVVAGGRDSLLVIQTQNDGGDWDLQIVDEVDLSGHVPADHEINAMNPTFDGAIWVVTNKAMVVRYDPHGGRISSLLLNEGEFVDNSLSSSGDGKVAIATGEALYLLEYQGNKIKQRWRQEYDRGSARKPGKLSWGTGSSPTFFGPVNGNEYVTIADNNDDGDRVVIFNARGPRKGRKRVVCTVELPSETIFGSECSPIGIGNSVVYTSSYGYPYPIEDILPSAIPITAPRHGGMFRVDIVDAKKNECEVVWQNSVKSSAVPTLSVQDETIYTFERLNGGSEGDHYLYTAVDFHTGEVVKSHFVGRGEVFNTLQLADNIGFDQVLWQGTRFGVIKVQPETYGSPDTR